MTGRDEFNLKEAFEMARMGMKTLVLVNGVGAITLITLLGNRLAVSAVPHATLQGLVCATVLLASGVFAAVFAMVLAYLTQYFYGCNYSDEDKKKFWHKISGGCNIFGLVVALISAGLFVWGIIQAAQTFEQLAG